MDIDIRLITLAILTSNDMKYFKELKQFLKNVNESLIIFPAFNIYFYFQYYVVPNNFQTCRQFFKDLFHRKSIHLLYNLHICVIRAVRISDLPGSTYNKSKHDSVYSIFSKKPNCILFMLLSFENVEYIIIIYLL